MPCTRLPEMKWLDLCLRFIKFLGNAGASLLKPVVTRSGNLLGRSKKGGPSRDRAVFERTLQNIWPWNWVPGAAGRSESVSANACQEDKLFVGASGRPPKRSNSAGKPHAPYHSHNEGSIPSLSLKNSVRVHIVIECIDAIIPVFNFHYIDPQVI